MSDQPFGFRVMAPSPHRGWQVWLPHQCGEWDIAGSEYGEPPLDQAEAIAELERFIAEAQQALNALREGREFDAEEQL